MADISTAVIQQVTPKILDRVQSLVPQFQQIADRLQQMHDKAMKYMPGLTGQMLLHYLYEDPPGAPWGWWYQRRDHPIDSQVD